MFLNSKKKIYIISILIPLAIGGLSALFSFNGMKEYSQLVRPPLSPPMAVFPIVWSILFILMGISSAIIYHSGLSKQRKEALKVYALQLAVNFFWSIFFFGLKWRLFAFIWLILLIVLTAIMIFKFFKISKLAGYLQIPYIIWLCFAAYLNISIWLLNR